MSAQVMFSDNASIVTLTVTNPETGKTATLNTVDEARCIAYWLRMFAQEQGVAVHALVVSVLCPEDAARQRFSMPSGLLRR